VRSSSTDDSSIRGALTATSPVRCLSTLHRLQPDNFQGGVNICAFPSFPQGRREAWTPFTPLGARNGGPAVELAILPGIRAHPSRRSIRLRSQAVIVSIAPYKARTAGLPRKICRTPLLKLNPPWPRRGARPSLAKWGWGGRGKKRLPSIWRRARIRLQS
jgi:hypothetical protein